MNQAAVSFRNVRNSDDYGFFHGKKNDRQVGDICVCLYTGAERVFDKKSIFRKIISDYIVIDEFHHAVNNQYLQIVNYFKPKFLLGLTATPERMDGRNIYEICDYNVPMKFHWGGN
ncbi:MAG: DEAD/DEAH box helicase family protein [Clostridium sp.]